MYGLRIFKLLYLLLCDARFMFKFYLQKGTRVIHFKRKKEKNIPNLRKYTLTFSDVRTIHKMVYLSFETFRN